MSTPVALVPRNRGQERTEIERRREHVWRMRFRERLTERQIVARLAKLDPPIVVNRSTVSRDIEFARANVRRSLRQGGFDARAELGAIVAGVESIIDLSFRDARRTEDGKERALHRKVALDAFGQLATLYQEHGLMEPRDFQRPPDEDGKRIERIPSATELLEWHTRFATLTVTKADVTSKAEVAWLYGDDQRGGESDDAA